MKRLYTVEFYRDMLARCRETVPGVAISSDFIVGFCGETEESFQRTCDLVREAGFKNSFIFKYSPRPGTKGHELLRRRRARGGQETPQQRPAGHPERRQPGGPSASSIGQHRRGAGGRAEQERLQAGRGPEPMQLTGRTTHRSHRRLRRQRTADRPDGAGRHRGRDVVHAVRHGGDRRTGGRGTRQRSESRGSRREAKRNGRSRSCDFSSLPSALCLGAKKGPFSWGHHLL